MKMSIEALLLAVTIVIFVAVIWFLFFYHAEVLPSPSPQIDLSNSVCVNDNCFYVELAQTNAQRERGLMYRNELDKNRGMLFIFDKDGVYPFWMKNTLIPLDIIWIDSTGKIVFIGQNIAPCKSFICPTASPGVKAKYVLEINGGMCKDIGLKIGDEAQINVK